MVIGLYPGSFDPITYGHIDIATRASRILDKLYLGVVDIRSSKTLVFDTDERLHLCQESLKHLQNVEVVIYSGLTVDTAKSLGAQVMVRGLRMGSDFEYEFELALNNQQLATDIDTIYLMAELSHMYIKSSLIKEIVANNGKATHLVPAHVLEALNTKYQTGQ